MGLRMRDKQCLYEIQLSINELKERFARLWDYWVILRDNLNDNDYNCQEALTAFHKEVYALRRSINSYSSLLLPSLVANLEGHLKGILDGKVLLTQPYLEKLSAILSKMELQFLREVRAFEAKDSTDFKSQNPL